MKTVFIDIANAPEKSDEELYSNYLASNDRSIMATLFRKYMPLVFGVSMKYLKEKNAAQDATMEVFERLLTHSPLSEVRRFKPFLYVVAKNHCLMKLRGEKPMEIEISIDDVEIANYVHPIDDDSNNKVEEALKKCLKNLKDLQRSCVESFYLKKKSYLEIAREFRVELTEVKSNIQNGKRNLKICLEGIHEA